MDSYYKLRQLFYYKVRHGLLQIATGITKCDDYYKLRQYNRSLRKSGKTLETTSGTFFCELLFCTSYPATLSTDLFLFDVMWFPAFSLGR